MANNENKKGKEETKDKNLYLLESIKENLNIDYEIFDFDNGQSEAEFVNRRIMVNPNEDPFIVLHEVGHILVGRLDSRNEEEIAAHGAAMVLTHYFGIPLPRNHKDYLESCKIEGKDVNNEETKPGNDLKMVKVEWVDANASLEPMSIEELKELEPITSVSVGYLIMETENHVVLSFMNFGEMMKHWQVIPKGMIKENGIKELREVTKNE